MSRKTDRIYIEALQALDEVNLRLNLGCDLYICVTQLGDCGSKFIGEMVCIKPTYDRRAEPSWGDQGDLGETTLGLGIRFR